MSITQEWAIKFITENMRDKGYSFFEKGDYNLNLIGVRGDELKANAFDDILLNIYKVRGEWVFDEFPITTDAGTYYLKKPMRTSGTALVVPNQYRGLWQLGRHRGLYEALVQRNELEVYRDNNKDSILDFDESTIEKGIFGINCHRSNPRGESKRVDKWSAGCQVFKSVYDFEQRFIPIIKKAKARWGNSFTYTLLNNKDLEI